MTHAQAEGNGGSVQPVTSDNPRAAGEIEYDSGAEVSFQGRMAGLVAEINAEAEAARAECLAGWWGPEAKARTETENEPEAEL